MPTFTGTAAGEIITGSDGDDIILGLAGDDIIYGGGGADLIDAGPGTNTVYAGDGDDTVVLMRDGQLNSLLYGEGGRDTLDASGPDFLNISIDASTGFLRLSSAGQVIASRIEGFERFIGTNGGNYIDLSSLSTSVEIVGGGFDDTLIGGSGADVLRGGGDRDEITLGEGDSGYGGDGADVFLITATAGIQALLDGGADSDAAVLKDYTAGSVINLRTGAVDGTAIQLVSIENIQLRYTTNASQPLTIICNDAGNTVGLFSSSSQTRRLTIEGGAGADFLTGYDVRGGGGDDILTGTLMTGGDGNDRCILSGVVNDLGVVREVNGGAGIDQISLQRDGATVTLDLREGTLSSISDALAYTARISGIEHAVGGTGRDTILGDAQTNQIEGLSGDDILIGRAGDDWLIGGSDNDTLDGGEGDDYLDGGQGRDVADYSTASAGVTVSLALAGPQATGGAGIDTLLDLEDIVGSAYADTLSGSASANTLRSGNGDDLLTGNAGNDLLDGGAGIDAALYSGLRRQYTARSTTVSGNDEGSDTLISIEEARFVDGTLTFDTASASAQVMRLYSATLNRLPDQAGLEANVGALANVGLQALANLFIGSAEFQARFGALSNQQFVEQMYVFALGRTGDPAGIAGWVNFLNNGMTRGQVVVGFSESAENQLRTAATLNAGLWVPDAEAQMIARLYDATFDRLPDTAGLAGWVAIYDAGAASLQQIAAAFAGSAEFQQRYGALSNQQFVEQMYRFCLDREGDPAGISGWTNFINNGMSRAEVLLNFSESPEHIALTAASWLGGIRYAGYVGAPVEDFDGKDAGAQVLPGDVDALIYDPADLAPTAKNDDAFVLPGDPDGGVKPAPPIDEDDTMPAPDVSSPMFETAGPAFVVLAHPGPEEAWIPVHRDGLELAWA